MKSDLKSFDNRLLPGYKKLRLISKQKDSVYWLMSKFDTVEDQDVYYIVQQIPRLKISIKDKIKRIKELKDSPLYKKFIKQQGVKNMVFEKQQIIDEP